MASGPPMLMPMVEPSGFALATTSVPRLPLAPGLFSTMKLLFGYSALRPSAIMRATTSGVEPGPNGAMMRTVCGGQLCASAGAAITSDSTNGNTRRFNMSVSSPLPLNVAPEIGAIAL
jgi:hypothetical protein